MPLTEIEFELPALQYELMGYPGLRQGEPLSIMLDAGVLLPDPAAASWFHVQERPLPALFKQVGRAAYAMAGRILEADVRKDEGFETAVVLVDCGEVLLRATCAPGEDGRLPFGTWETRTLVGLARVQGIVEDDFSTTIGRSIDVTIWSVRRLVLTPGDPLFGVWHTSSELQPSPFRYDQILLTAHIHRMRG